ncbi:hypothetical protein L914_20671 [Phytophthora nicotianae]|uniref:Uncharacterized protein n=1 Tax=Phytophthora nicotianae TaxID=4792 RepID=W2M8E5_PHYNI|nr:hypothetical protein L914_20671 [Phytophthora nicotianae]
MMSGCSEQTKTSARCFFEAQDNPLHQACGADRKQLPCTGYSNLVSHLASRHEEFGVQYDARHRGAERLLQAFGFVSEETSHRYQWLRWVVERNMPLFEVDDEQTGAMSKWRPTNPKALKADMITVPSKVGAIIAKEMGNLFGIMFNGWSRGTMHFAGVSVSTSLADTFNAHCSRCRHWAMAVKTPMRISP